MKTAWWGNILASLLMKIQLGSPTSWRGSISTYRDQPEPDLCNGGKQYMLQAVDGKSAHTEGYYLAEKNAESTLAAFKSYHVMAERQTRKKLQCIRTDGGGEFCNELWETYCKEFGILHKTTSTYSSQSNGIVKCANWTVIEHVRVLLHDSGLPASMWCEVASMVLYLKDFIPIARCPDTTPFEDWWGFKPDVSHLWPFGCVAYVKIPTEMDGGRLAPWSLKCVLIDYFGHDAYHLLNKLTGKTYHSQDVIFEEGIGHHTLSAPQVSNEGEIDHVVLQPIGDTQPFPNPTGSTQPCKGTQLSALISRIFLNPNSEHTPLMQNSIRPPIPSTTP